MICAEIREMIEAYALEALDASDQAIVETHLAECPDCRRLLHEYVEIINAMPQAITLATPLQPPAALKARLLQSLEAAPLQTSEVPKTSEITLPAPAREKLPPISAWSRPAWWRVRNLVAVATALLMVLLLIWSVQLSVALARERALRAEFANLVDQQEIVLEVIDSNKTSRAVLLPPQGSDSNAYGKLFTRADMPHVVAMAARLPQPPSGQAYHLWVTGQGQTELAGMMKVNEQGFGLLVFDENHNGPIYDSVRVTLQPVGSQTPSDSPTLLWSAPQE